MTGDDTPVMIHKQCIYQWTSRDRRFYFLSLIPFFIAFVGATCILAISSPYLVIIFISLYILGNIFQAGACVGCPYRGKFCPAIFGVYLSNIISSIIYKKRSFKQQFFNINANLASTTSIIALIFPIYWLFASGWYYLVGYIVLIALHLYLFFPNFCLKCDYNDTCPGGRTVRQLLKK